MLPIPPSTARSAQEPARIVIEGAMTPGAPSLMMPTASTTDTYNTYLHPLQGISPRHSAAAGGSASPRSLKISVAPAAEDEGTESDIASTSSLHQPLSASNRGYPSSASDGASSSRNPQPPSARPSRFQHRRWSGRSQQAANSSGSRDPDSQCNTGSTTPASCSLVEDCDYTGRGSSSAVSSASHVSRTSASDAQISRLSNWLASSLQTIVEAMHADDDRKSQSDLSTIDLLQTFGRTRPRAVSTTASTSTTSTIPMSVGADRMNLRSLSRFSLARTSRASSVLYAGGATTPHDRCFYRTASVGGGLAESVQPITMPEAQAMSQERCRLLAAQMLHILGQLLQETQWLGTQNCVLLSAEAKKLFLDLIERLVFDTSAILKRLNDEVSKHNNAVSPEVSVATQERVVASVSTLMDSFGCHFEWKPCVSVFIPWLVKLIGRGDVPLMGAILGCSELIHALSGKDAKFLVSCCVSSLDLEFSNPSGCLLVLLQQLPLAPRIRIEADALRTVWQEAIALIVREGSATGKSLATDDRLRIVDFFEALHTTSPFRSLPTEIASTTNLMPIVCPAVRGLGPQSTNHGTSDSLSSARNAFHNSHSSLQGLGKGTNSAVASPRVASLQSNVPVSVGASGITPLMDTSAQTNLRLQCLSKVDFFETEANDRQTIFSRACRQGDTALVERLITLAHVMFDATADRTAQVLNRVQSDGTNALQQATARGHLSTVKVLCQIANEYISASFHHVVKGKGTVLDIARTPKQEGAAAGILQCLTMKYNVLIVPQPPAGEALRTKSKRSSIDKHGDDNTTPSDFVLLQLPLDDDTNMMADTLSRITVPEMELGSGPYPASMLAGSSVMGASSSTNPIAELNIAPASDMSATSCYRKVADALQHHFHEAIQQTRRVEGAARTLLEGLSHDDCENIKMWLTTATTRVKMLTFDKGSMASTSWNAAVAEINHISTMTIQLVRDVLVQYFFGAAFIATHPLNHSSKMVNIIANPNDPQTQLEMTRSLDEVSLGTEKLVHYLNRHIIDMHGQAPEPLAQLSISQLFGYNRDTTPMPSRLFRFLSCVQAAPAFQPTSSEALLWIPMPVLGYIDGWYIASLTVDGMLPALLSCTLDAIPSDCLRDLRLKRLIAEGNLPDGKQEGPQLPLQILTAMVLMVGHVLDFGLLNPRAATEATLSQLLRSEPVPPEICVQLLEALKNQCADMLTIYSSFSDGAAADLRTQHRRPVRHAAAFVVSRFLALKYLEDLFQSRQLWKRAHHLAVASAINAGEGKSGDSCGSQDNLAFEGTGTFDEMMYTGSTEPWVSCTSPLVPGASGSKRVVYSNSGAMPIDSITPSLASEKSSSGAQWWVCGSDLAQQCVSSLLWVALRMFPDFDDPQVVMDPRRVDLCEWVIEGLSSSSTLQPPSTLSDRLRSAIEAMVSGDEKTVCWETNRYLPANSFWLAARCFHRASIAGDVSLMNGILRLVSKSHQSHLQLSCNINALLTFEGGCGLSSLLLGIISGLRSVISFNISAASTPSFRSPSTSTSVISKCQPWYASKRLSIQGEGPLDAFWISRQLGASEKNEDLISGILQQRL